MMPVVPRSGAQNANRSSAPSITSLGMLARPAKNMINGTSSAKRRRRPQKRSSRKLPRSVQSAKRMFISGLVAIISPVCVAMSGAMSVPPLSSRTNMASSTAAITLVVPNTTPSSISSTHREIAPPVSLLPLDSASLLHCCGRDRGNLEVAKKPGEDRHLRPLDSRMLGRRRPRRGLELAI